VRVILDINVFVSGVFFSGPPFRILEACEANRGRTSVYKLTTSSFDAFWSTFNLKGIYGPDFPGQTFRVLKEKEEREFGEYRTRRLVLEAWDKLEQK